MIPNGRFFLPLFAAAALLCSAVSAQESTAKQPSEGRVATAILAATQGNEASGTVTFFEIESGGVLIAAEVRGLTPGPHGFSIHVRGDCSAPDARSAGGHFNPNNGHHGAPNVSYSHAGDLGNLDADASGIAYFSFHADDLAFDGANSILNRSIVVREKGDDYLTQPDGDAGDRIACGVIELSQPANSLDPKRPVANR